MVEALRIRQREYKTAIKNFSRIPERSKALPQDSSDSEYRPETASSE